ncbi:MAG: LacI family DNA-binding transcriptional regulator [Pirellulales bacterium]|nr:LacI family DNA-binding transcriptional regulator [Pirellulales bacterium]
MAKEANVSLRTATRVVNNEPHVRATTRQLVREAAARLGWCPNAHARHLVRGRTDRLGVILPDSRNTIFSDIASAIEAQAQVQSYDCLFLHSEGVPEREAKFLSLAMDGTVDGLIVMANVLKENHEIYTRLLEDRIPMVFRAGPETPGTVDLVAVDLEMAGYMATRHLLKLGHRHIGMILQEAAKERQTGRVDGYTRAHREEDICVHPEYRIYCGYRVKDGYHAMRCLLEAHPKITAVLCHNDQLALGSFRAARELGRRIPDNLAVVGYDNIELGRFCEVPLTTIGYSKGLLGQLLVDMICRRIKEPNHPSQRIVLPPELIIRESCGYAIRR